MVGRVDELSIAALPARDVHQPQRRLQVPVLEGQVQRRLPLRTLRAERQLPPLRPRAAHQGLHYLEQCHVYVACDRK